MAEVESVLSRFTGIDEVELDSSFGAPAQHCVARKLRAVVKADGFGKPTFKARSSKQRILSRLPNEKPASRARHSRVKSSTTAIARTFRPFANRSWAKSTRLESPSPYMRGNSGATHRRPKKPSEKRKNQ
jgi:hypothetical protein